MALGLHVADIGALNCAAGEPFGVFDDGAEGVAVIGIAWQRLGVKHELAARCAGIGSDDRGLDAELVRRARFALADALNLGSMEGIELPPALALLLGADLVGKAPACRRAACASGSGPSARVETHAGRTLRR